MAIVSNARVAGLLYLVVVATGIFSLAYIPSRIHVPGDPAETVVRILTMEPLFRAGIAAGVVCYVAFLLLPFALHRLLEPAGAIAARLMVALAVVSVPIALLNLARRLDALTLIQAGNAEQAAVALTSVGNGMVMVQIFWGLWLLPLGWLIVRSGAIPRILGVLLMLGCLGYLVKVFGSILLADFFALPGVRYVSIPGSIGEIGTCLWLTLVGAKPIAETSGD